jgi:hypothetical protein
VNSWPNFLTHTEDNSAGNGGNGYFAGSLIGKSYAAFEPLNVAQTGSHATGHANQTNITYFDQSATQIAGVGGDGGNWNAASGGSVGAFGLSAMAQSPPVTTAPAMVAMAPSSGQWCMLLSRSMPR